MTPSIIKLHHPFEESNRYLYVSRIQIHEGHIMFSFALNHKWALKLTNRKLIKRACNKIAVLYGIKGKKGKPQIIPINE